MKHKILKTFILTFILLLPMVILVGCGTTNESNQDNELKQDNVFYFDDANININNINFSFSCSETKIQMYLFY